MTSLKYFCKKGINRINTLICTEGDEILIHKEIQNGNIQVTGVKGWCNKTEFELTAKELAKNFILIE